MTTSENFFGLNQQKYFQSENLKYPRKFKDLHNKPVFTIKILFMWRAQVTFMKNIWSWLVLFYIFMSPSSKHMRSLICFTFLCPPQVKQIKMTFLSLPMSNTLDICIIINMYKEPVRHAIIRCMCLSYAKAGF